MKLDFLMKVALVNLYFTKWTPRISAVHVIPSVSGDTGWILSPPFRVLLLRHLRLPLPLSVHSCCCGRRLLATTGQLVAGQGFLVDVVSQLRNLDIARSSTDTRRLEVVAEGLAGFGGVQLGHRRNLVSAHHCDGTPLQKADTMNGIALQHARKRKEDRYPELCGLEG